MILRDDQPVEQTEERTLHRIGFPAEPVWLTVEEYIDLCRGQLDNRQFPESPRSLPELEAFVDCFPDHSHMVRPKPGIIHREGWPKYLGRPVPPLKPAARERIIQTVIDDPDFAAALAMVLQPHLSGDAA